ncbi:hypothetical protein ACROYT_G011144 [Oculina patagonica]
MQHFKALVVLLVFAAVCISFTDAWTMGAKKGKRDDREPARDDFRPRMDDSAARLKEKRFRFEDWEREPQL